MYPRSTAARKPTWVPFQDREMPPAFLLISYSNCSGGSKHFEVANYDLTKQSWEIVSAYAFTEQGVAMLSSVLHSERAIHVNIAIIIRPFVQLREMIGSTKGLARDPMNWKRNATTSFGSSSRRFGN
jgi:hypothetical protein